MKHNCFDHIVLACCAGCGIRMGYKRLHWFARKAVTLANSIGENLGGSSMVFSEQTAK